MKNKFLARWMNSASYAPPDAPGSGGAAPAAPSSAPASGGDSPAPQPSGTPSSTPAGTDTPSDDFSGFDSAGDDFDSVELGADSDSSQDPTVVPAVVPVVPAVPAAPAPVAAVPAVAPAANVPKADASPPSEVDSLLSNLSENAPALATWLEQNAYKLTKEEIDAFELDAVGQIPKLMARVQVASMKATVNLIKNLVPKLIDSQVEKTSGVKEKSKAALNEFYTTNSDLNEKDHAALVNKWAGAFRAQNPTASRQEAIKFVGQAIRTELGLAPLVPGAPAKARPQPFSPARPGARQPVAQTVEENLFSGLGIDLEE